MSGTAVENYLKNLVDYVKIIAGQDVLQDV